jgi:hypothetical protein
MKCWMLRRSLKGGLLNENTPPGTPLDIFLQWDEGDIQPVGSLAYRDQIAYLEYDEAFLKSGLEISPVHHKTSAGLTQPYDARVFLKH